MAKFDGIFEIKGTLQGMSFYKSKDGMLIRKKGGVDKSRIKNDPAFQRTRENGSEFGHNAKMGQLMRKSVANLLSLAKDYRVSSRMSQAMSRIKNLDFTSPRGDRKVWIGIASDEGKQALRGFDFNLNSPFNSVFRSQYVLDTVTGAVTIANFNPATNLSLPQGATHASFSVSVASVDFELENYGTTYSPKENFALVDGSLDLTLTPSGMPGGTGSTFFYFLIEFFQELNGVQYPLKNNSHNVLYLMEVV
ncbi:hypothetical protein [Flavobacterium haoranii]|uniref:Uncharacterized protein n=1 Tax=Flavobacterium haoranii TaxID=683124 RepID=A0A1M6CH79_9FLAO|nr:hypothetical protein [Flavobacterium haoranii]SHI60357.1 hypothetical protein SAMN05444337_0376 [Flavobacterium haoranii]